MNLTKTAQTAATKSKLEAVARALFSERGFEAVSAEELVAKAKVTRGALYHHYNGKEGLFAAVVETVMRELHAELVRETAGLADPLSALQRGVAIFLKACSEPEVQRILLVDAPAVLGWQAWRKMDAQYGLGLGPVRLVGCDGNGAAAPAGCRRCCPRSPGRGDGGCDADRPLAKSFQGAQGGRADARGAHRKLSYQVRRLWRIHPGLSKGGLRSGCGQNAGANPIRSPWLRHKEC
jgi:hypothetical protein